MRIPTIIVCFIVLIGFSFAACDHFTNDADQSHIIHPEVSNSAMQPAKIDSGVLSVPVSCPLIIGQTERSIIDAGLIDIKKIDTSIAVDLKYSTCDNFLGVDVYGDFNKCYLQPDVAEKLKTAQQLLRSRFPFYRLIIFDAVRPRSVQYKMWDTIAVPYAERSKYVSNPKNGSLHNYGAAVDVSIIDENHIELDMGTPYDYFGELAYPREEERMIKEGKLTHLQLLNRELLREVMSQAGFMNITTEWWHFNSCNRNEASVKYKIVE